MTRVAKKSLVTLEELRQMRLDEGLLQVAANARWIRRADDERDLLLDQRESAVVAWRRQLGQGSSLSVDAMQFHSQHLKFHLDRLVEVDAKRAELEVERGRLAELVRGFERDVELIARATRKLGEESLRDSQRREMRRADDEWLRARQLNRKAAS
jgi:hypothetical protein